MKKYKTWVTLFCHECKQEYFCYGSGLWGCPECRSYEFNNLTVCKGYNKECNEQIIMKNTDFKKKEDFYCDSCIQDYEEDLKKREQESEEVEYCKEKDCDGVIEFSDGLHICSTCGIVSECEEEIERRYTFNRMKTVHSGKDLPSGSR